MARASTLRRLLRTGPVGRHALVASVALVALAAIASAPLASGEPRLRLPPQRIFDDPEAPAAVVFSHESHVERAGRRCVACHPQPFSILGRHAAVSHEEMERGGSCGVCHNGSDASAVDDVESCESCHTGAPPAQLTLAGGEASPGRVVFRHTTHRQPCGACHPRPFAMHAGATPLIKDEMFEGATCGSCHDGEAAFGVGDAEHCATCHRAEGSGS